MTALSAAEIAARTGGHVEGAAGARADSWAFDSRRLVRGACFVALRDQRDGHDFVRAAFDSGATIALVDRELDSMPALSSGQALVRVADTLRALQDLARSVRADRGDLDVVAVAGSTGKTSTKDLLAATLAPLACYANPESFNNEFGVPLTLCNAPTAARVVVTEMGERFAGDLALLCDIARPRVGVVTNVGLAHAEHLGGTDGAAAVLAELLDALPADGVAVMNADDDWTPKLRTRTAAAVVTVGRDPGADYVISHVEIDAELRASFALNGHPIRVPLHGGHHVANAAQAAAVADRVFAMPFDEIAAELAGAETGRWRMELMETADGITILNDAYNANPTSMEAALVALAHLPIAGRRIAVLGEMRELGAHADAAHHAVGARTAALALDLVVAVGAGAGKLADAARTAGVSVEDARDADDAIAIVDTIVRRGDAVLCKASRAVGLERVAEQLVVRHSGGGAKGGAA